MSNLTGNEERYCQELIKMETMPELRLTQVKCYEIAYPEQAKTSTKKSLYELSSVKASNIKIISRVKELRAEVTKSIKYDVEDCFNEFEALRELSIQAEDRNVAKSCIENKGKLKGLYIEKSKIEVKDISPAKEKVADKVKKLIGK